MPAKILMLVGDYVEDYEAMVPYQMLLMLGHQVDSQVLEQLLEQHSTVKPPPWQCPLAWLLRLLRARLAALSSSALPGGGQPSGRPATASCARASRLHSRRFYRL